MDKITYKKAVREMKRKRKTTLSCYVCGEDDPSIIKMHHVDGKKNSDLTMPLCPTCHEKITKNQNFLSVNKRKDNSDLGRLAYKLVTHGSLLKLVGEEQIKEGLDLYDEYCD